MRARITTFATAGLLLAVVATGLAAYEPAETTTGEPVVAYRINAGGPDLAGGWARDTARRPSEYVNDDDTKTAITGQPVVVDQGTVPAGTPPELFQSERWDPDPDPRMRWRLPVDPGTYEVRLYFAETYADAFAPEAREFGVAIEGSLVLKNFDVFTEAGGAYRGIMRSFVVESDRRLRIAFRNTDAQHPAVKGIEVLALDGAAPAKPTPGAEEPEPTEPPANEPPTNETPAPAPPSGDCSVDIGAGANVQAAVDKHPAGTAFCLHGTYKFSQAVVPKSGQSFVGPATIVGAGADMGFELEKGSGGAEGVSFVNLDMSGFVLRAIECFGGTQVIGGRYHHNGRNGIGCGLDYTSGALLFDGVEIDHNGSEQHLGSGAGGVKIARLGEDGMTVRNSFIHDNLGNGVWCDVQCIGTFLIENNVISSNSRKGVHYEKSGASDEYIKGRVVEGQAIIRHNLVTDNGWEGREHAADGGISGVSSRNMLIENNVTSGNGRGGVFLRTDGRLSGEKHGWQTQAIVRNNDSPDGVGNCSEPLVECINNG